MHLLSRSSFVLLLILLPFSQRVTAQLFGRNQDRQATVVVEGTVKNLFVREGAGRADRLVQLTVRRSEVLAQSQRPIRYPAPGETIYVLAAADSRPTRSFGRDRAPTLPAEGDVIRAQLAVAEDGTWRNASDDWFESLGTNAVERDDPSEDSEVNRPAPTRSILGMSFEALELRGRLALRVTRLEEDSPAARAGLEIGDLVVGVNGQAIGNLDALQEMLRQATDIRLAVIDVNSGRLAEVPIQGSGVTPRDRSSDRAPEVTRRDRTSGGTRATPPSLGISAERVSLGLRSALKVTSVQPDSIAAQAGLEVGDVIVKANGIALTSPEQLAAALRKSGDVMTLTVRDVRTGRDVPVELNLGGGSAESPISPSSTDSRGNSGRMGVVTELTFYDVEAAVKVTEVEPGSPGERAGLTPGLIILDVNGQKLLHPNDLLEAEREGGKLRMTVVNPSSGRRAQVVVNLGG